MSRPCSTSFSRPIMVNSVTPIPTPPMARAMIAIAIFGVVVLVAVGDCMTLLMCLLFEVLEIQGWAAATAVGLDKAWTPLREPPGRCGYSLDSGRCAWAFPLSPIEWGG